MGVLTAVRRSLVALRDGVDQRLHPRRRRLALAQLRALAPRSMLFVCLGNVCRSPYAERVSSARGDGELSVDSAGFIGPGRSPPDAAMTAARARGIEHADHVSKTLTPPLLEAAEVTFVFDRHNARRLRTAPGARADRIFWLGDLDPEWAGKRAIVDPWGKPLDEFDRTFARIERCVDEVLRVIGRGTDP